MSTVSIIAPAELQAIRPLRMKAVAASTGTRVTRIAAAVPSRSTPGLEHVVYLDVATGRALHAVNGCRCPAALHGRSCWHVEAVRKAAVEAGFLPKPSVWDAPMKRDRDEEI